MPRLSRQRALNPLVLLTLLPGLVLAVFLILAVPSTMQWRVPGSNAEWVNPHAVEDQKAMEGGEIRFRVIANSDDPHDQELKLLVRDAVVPLVNAAASHAKTPEEALEAVKAAEGEIVAAARRTLRAHLPAYDNQPARGGAVEGDIRVRLETPNPQRVELILGQGLGHNWWCVMFPPMCLAEPVVRPAFLHPRFTQPHPEPAQPYSESGRVIIRFALLDWLQKYR